MSSQQYLKTIQHELNSTYAASTAYPTWLDKYHLEHLDKSDNYLDMFNDVCLMFQEFCKHKVRVKPEDIEETADRLFYIISTSTQPTLSMATVVSSLHANSTVTFTGDYGTDVQLWADCLMEMSNVGLYDVFISPGGHPVVTCNIEVDVDLKKELSEKFSSILPQINGSMDENNCPVDVRYSGKSTKRKIKLNQKDWEVLDCVNSQAWKTDPAILAMKYYVPSITDTGKALTEDEKEMARVYFNRFKSIADWAYEEDELIQAVTTMDSRGRFYNFLTDPHIRLSLRSRKREGFLTDWELDHLTSP